MFGISMRFLDRQMMTVTVIVWAAAAFLTLGAMSALLNAVRSGVYQIEGSAMSLPTVSRNEVPVSEAELKKTIERLLVLHPGLKITINKGDLKISADRPDQFADWGATIADVLQSGDRSMYYETDTLCAARCDGGFFVAVFKPKRVNFVVN